MAVALLSFLAIQSQAEFEMYPALGFNSHFKSAVQNQSADALFKNWQGLMIANGDIWFSQARLGGKTNFVWKYHVIGINLPKNGSQE